MNRTRTLHVLAPLAAVLALGGGTARASAPEFRPIAGAFQPPSTVSAIKLSGSSFFLGGAGGVDRIRASDGSRVAGFRVSVDGSVRALAVAGSTLVIGGEFSSVNGQPRSNLAAVDAATGELAPAFAPAVPDRVLALAVRGGFVYIGGACTSVSGQEHRLVAKLSLATGRPVASWRPRLGGGLAPVVGALAASGSRVYAGGTFEAVNGARRLKLAALDAGSGAPVRSFRKGQLGDQDVVYRIVPARGQLFVGGLIRSVDGSPRSRSRRLVSLSPTTGSVNRAFRPSGLSTVRDFAVSGATIVAAQPNWVTLLRVSDGSRIGFRLTFLPFGINALALSAGRLVLGGDGPSRRVGLYAVS